MQGPGGSEPTQFEKYGLTAEEYVRWHRSHLAGEEVDPDLARRVDLFLREWRRESADQEDRTRWESKIRRLVRRAGILDPRPSGGGTLTTEPIVVFYKPLLEDFQFFDQSGCRLGVDRRTSDRFRQVVDYRSELRDTQLRCVVANAPKARWSTGAEAYQVLAPDGSLIATARREKTGGRECALFSEPEGAPMATLRRTDDDEFIKTAPRLSEPSWRERAWRVHDRWLAAGVVSLEDVSGARVARITYLIPAYPAVNWALVLEPQRGLREPLATIALAACVIAYWRLLPVIGGG